MVSFDKLLSADAQSVATLDEAVLFDRLPVGVYVCDADGFIVRYNRAASRLWGREPRLKEPESRFCGSYRLISLDGEHVSHVDCPMAVALTTGQDVHDQQIQIERADGSRIMAVVNIEVITDDDGNVTGAINVFRELPRYNVQTPPETEGQRLKDVLQALPAAIYTTDADGRLLFYNEAAAELWGVRPEIGRTEFCGSWKLYWPDGTPLPHDECPMAIALKEERAVSGMEAIAERPDGSRVQFLAWPTPLLDESGAVIGAVNMLVDLSDRNSAAQATQRLAAIVESSEDAILSKDLDGTIMSWNAGAERLFGYTGDEVLGKSILILIPEDRYEEENEILASIRRGERIEHYETVRRHGDGHLIAISLSVSPIKNPRGEVVGASTIARDITDRKRAEEQKSLLIREMNHRVRNLFALASGLVAASARTAGSAEDLASTARERFGALARAHALTLPQTTDASAEAEGTTLHALIRTIILPFTDDFDGRVMVSGPDLPIAGSAISNFALVLHEFATNAAKYGALAAPDRQLVIESGEENGQFALTWRESGAFPPAFEPAHEGFGTLLARSTVIGSLGGRFDREFGPQGLVIKLSLPRNCLTGES